MIPCKHWTDCGAANGGCCALEDSPFGKRVSSGVCLKVCDKYDGPSRGLGDTIERFTRITGVKAVTEGVAKMRGKPCSCGKRRAALNQAVPYDSK